MKYSLAFAAVLGLLTFVSLPAPAADQPYFGPEIRYKPDQRFAMPTNKATGLNNAKNVVIKEVTLSAVPEFIRIQAETLAESCTKDVENKKLMKFYRYTSDATRDNSLSASYLIDLAGLAAKPQQTCVLGNACTKDGCMVVGYNSTAYEKWSQHFMTRQKSWEYKNVEDSKLKVILTVLEFTAKCKGAAAAPEKKDDPGCVAKRLWLESGLVEYKNGGMLDNVSPFVETPPEDAPDAPAPSVDEAPAAAPTEAPAPAEAPAEPTE